MNNKLSEGICALQSVIELFDIAEKQHCELYELVQDLNKEQDDLLHEIEFKDNVDKTEELQKVRRTRRAAKDIMEEWFPLKSYAKNHRELKNDFRTLIKEIENVREKHKTRVYTPRTLSNETGSKHILVPKVDITQQLKEIERRRQENKRKNN